MPLTFTHETLGQRVLFGSGSVAKNIAAEVSRLGAERVMLIAAPCEQEIAAKATSLITVAVTFDNVVQHVPIENAEEARGVASSANIDLLISVGGGSTTGLAKAVALTTGIPIVAVATTYAGSEATNVWGMTEGSRKTTGIDHRVLPVSVIYDPELTYSLPVELTVASGMNAIAHCVDSMWAPRTDPINQALAAEGIRALTSGLPQIVADPGSVPGRDEALYGAYLSAVSFASAGSGIHHKICHVLGGAYNLPHAQTHATVLPYVLAFNAPYAAQAERRLAAAFGAETATAGLGALREALAAPRRLSDYGFQESMIPEAVELILPVIPESNPRRVTAENLSALLGAALRGDAAGAVD